MIQLSLLFIDEFVIILYRIQAWPKKILSLIKLKYIKMIKKILIVSVLFFLDKVAIAQQKIPNWVFVGETAEDDLVYIDINNINHK